MHNRFCSPPYRVAGSAAMLNTRRAGTQNRSAASLAQESVTGQRDVARRLMVLRLAAFRPHLYMRDRGVKLDGHVGQIAGL